MALIIAGLQLLVVNNWTELQSCMVIESVNPRLGYILSCLHYEVTQMMKESLSESEA